MIKQLYPGFAFLIFLIVDALLYGIFIVIALAYLGLIGTITYFLGKLGVLLIIHGLSTANYFIMGQGVIVITIATVFTVFNLVAFCIIITEKPSKEESNFRKITYGLGL